MFVLAFNGFAENINRLSSIPLLQGSQNLPNLNVPVSTDLLLQMQAYKAKMGANVTWEDYFWTTSQDAAGDADVEILGVEMRLGLVGYRYTSSGSAKNRFFSQIGQGVKPALPNTVKPELVAVTFRFGDYVYKYNPLDPANFELIKVIKHRLTRATKPRNFEQRVTRP